MRGILFILPLLPTAFVYAENTPGSARQAFIQAGLVPDVLSSFNPVLPLDVTYTIPGTGQQKAVAPPGKNFTRPQTLNAPTWSIPSDSRHLAHETFVVAMVDPDAPTPQSPTNAQIRHFLGGNFRLQSSPSEPGVGAALVNITPALSEYRQPTPPNTSDPHRYTWLLYRQPLDFPTTISSNVTNFNISAFAQEFGLGQPLAGNFMTLSTNPAALAAAGES
ncbi:phosphatidylethanolamine-binding protein [Gautieria morchelliformis]|nr:phosphatidylethanolamine-binding protein [Gautieria morchelliformis]